MQHRYAPPTAALDVPVVAQPTLQKRTKITLSVIAGTLFVLGIALVAFAIYGYSITKANDRFGYVFSFVCIAFGLAMSGAAVGIHLGWRSAAWVLVAITGVPSIATVIAPATNTAMVVMRALLLALFGASLACVWLLSRRLKQ